MLAPYVTTLNQACVAAALAATAPPGEELFQETVAQAFRSHGLKVFRDPFYPGPYLLGYTASARTDVVAVLPGADDIWLEMKFYWDLGKPRPAASCIPGHIDHDIYKLRTANASPYSHFLIVGLFANSATSASCIKIDSHLAAQGLTVQHRLVTAIAPLTYAPAPSEIILWVVDI